MALNWSVKKVFSSTVTNLTLSKVIIFSFIANIRVFSFCNTLTLSFKAITSSSMLFAAYSVFKSSSWNPWVYPAFIETYFPITRSSTTSLYLPPIHSCCPLTFILRNWTHGSQSWTRKSWKTSSPFRIHILPQRFAG